MDVDALLESLHEVGVAAQVGHYAEFYLGVVGGQDETVRTARDKGPPDLLSPFGPDRDVLQVGVGGTKSPCRRKGLVESSVDLAVGRVYVGGEGFDVSGEEFLRAPELQDLIDHGMLVRYSLEGGLVRRICPVGILLRLETKMHLVEQHFAYLFRRGHIERRFPGHLPYRPLPGSHLFLQPFGEILERADVDADAVPFHLREDLHQRFLHLVVEIPCAGVLEG